jgi:hypothetical protein
MPKAWLDQWRARVGEDEADRIMKETSGDGTLIHKVTEMHDKGEKDKVKALISQWPWLLPYWLAWKVWSEERIAEWIWIEKTAVHTTLRVGGTIDRLGVFKNDPSGTIVDIKSSSSLNPGMGVQLYAYRAIAMDTIERCRLPQYWKPERTVIAHMPGPRWTTVDGRTVNSTELDRVVVKEYAWRDYQNEALDVINGYWALAT